MNILISGSSGFIGKHLTKRFESEGHSVVGLTSRNCDLTKQDSLEKLKHPPYDMIFHLAAWTRAGDFCLHHGGEQWIVNQQMNTNMLAWWNAFQPQAKLVALGTSASYATEQNLVEESYLQGIPNEKFFPYAMSKRMLYVGLESFRKQFGKKYLYLVPSTVYGPEYHTDGRELHFIYDLIRKILRGKKLGEEVVLWGDGQQRRELVYIDDFVDILVKLASKHENDIVNIGGGEDYSIRQFAEMICEVVGYDVSRIKYDKDKYVGARSKILSVEKLSRLLPQRRKTAIREGIRLTIEWVEKAGLAS